MEPGVNIWLELVLVDISMKATNFAPFASSLNSIVTGAGMTLPSGRDSWGAKRSLFR